MTDNPQPVEAVRVRWRICEVCPFVWLEIEDDSDFKNCLKCGADIQEAVPLATLEERERELEALQIIAQGDKNTMEIWEAEAKRWRGRTEKAEAALADRDREIDRLKNLVDDWYEHAQNFKAQLADRDRVVGTLRDEYNALADRWEQVNERAAKAEATLEERERQIDLLIASKDKATAALADRDREIERLKNLVDDWYEHAQNFKAQLADRDRVVEELVPFLRHVLADDPPDGGWPYDPDSPLQVNPRIRDLLASYEQQRRSDG